MHAVFPLIGQTLAGVTASSLFEARLGREEMNREVHIYSPAYDEAEFDDILGLSDHIVFNSFAQWERFRERVRSFSGHPVSCGIRVNPEHSEAAVPLYDPCAPFSRLGAPGPVSVRISWTASKGSTSTHLCEQNADALERTAKVVDEKFGATIARMKWLNMGGGHHITRPDYDIPALVRTIRFFQDKYGVQVYLEPGEAIALGTATGLPGAGYRRKRDEHRSPGRVRGLPHAGCARDALPAGSAGAGLPGDKPYTYRLAGTTCLAGDVIGDYSFDQPLRPGDQVVFEDMAHYTMVKNNLFNGVRLPSIALYTETEEMRVLRSFGYDEYRNRLS
jgi:carboxynorspermidine decarboxylase